MVRVLSISTLFPSPARTSFGLFVARQAQAVAARGDIELVVANPVAIAPPPFHRFFNSPAERALPAQGHDWGVEIHYPRFTHLPRVGWRWNPTLIARAVLPLVCRLHREKPFDVVDAQFFYPDGPAAAQVAAAFGLPLSIKARGSDIHLWGERPAALRQMRAAADRAGGLLSVSEALKRDMAALGMPPNKIAVHYTGLDHALFRPRPRTEARAAIAEMLGIPSDGPLLVTVGNLIPLKGQDLVVEALAAVPGARLVLAGKGPEGAALEALSKRLGLSQRVHLAGSVEPVDLALLLAAADTMVLPSQREGLANAWIEALACGAPLVITDVGGAREVVGAPSAGRVVERNPAALAAAIRDLLGDPPGQPEVAANAARFSWEANAAQLADHWKKLASSRT
jgi:glycosyltransferase involved in cell wall biosynthesis